MANQQLTCAIQMGSKMSKPISGSTLGTRIPTVWGLVKKGKDWLEDYLTPQQSTK